MAQGESKPMTRQQEATPAPWMQVPMGPALSKYLSLPLTGSDEQSSDKRSVVTEPTGFEPRLDPVESLVHHLRGVHASRPDLDVATVVDLLDELVTMAIPEAALDLVKAYPDSIKDDDFRAQLALGVGAMLAGDLNQAESALCKAQAVLPNEPAPYVNLAQIFHSQGRLDEAEVWCLAGLEAEVNNHRLWELLAVLYRDQMGDYMPEHLLKVAEKRTSWAGVALATSLIATGDRYFKSSLLEKFYFQGERDPLFLIELTGAYGVAGEHEKIPAIVWQAERMATKGLPWQLHVHAAQAQLAMGQLSEFKNQLDKARKDPFIPDEALAALKELEFDAESGNLH